MDQKFQNDENKPGPMVEEEDDDFEDVEIKDTDILERIARSTYNSFNTSVMVATMIEKTNNMDARLRVTESIFRAGMMKTFQLQRENKMIVMNNYLEAVQYLVPSMAISLPDFLNIICSYDYAQYCWDTETEKVRRATVCQMLRTARSSVSCDFWSTREHQGMRAVVAKIYTFFVDSMKTDLAEADKRDSRPKTDFERGFLEYFALDDFFINLLKLSDSPKIQGVPRFRSEVQEAMKAFDNREIVFEKTDTSLDYEFNHSIVDSTISVFVCARMNVHYREMASDIKDAAQMVGVGPMWMWRNALRTIIQLMTEKETPFDSPIRAFVETFFLVRLPLMIDMDAPQKRELLEHTARDMEHALNYLPSELWILFQEALEQNGYPQGQRIDPERWNPERPNRLLIHSAIAAKAVEEVGKVESTEDIVTLLPSLFDSSCIALNCSLAHLSVRGAIHKMTAMLADVNRAMEVPVPGVSGDQRWRRFDATFCALLHTYYTINRLTVRRMVCGEGRGTENRKGVFYRWVSRFGRRDTTPNDKRDMDNTLDEQRDERRERARGFIQRLRSQCPLTEDDSNYSDVFDVLPYLARLLLEEAGKNAFDMSTALSTLSSSPSIVYALLMWLYCLDHSEARVALVRSMDRVMRDMQGVDDVWRFMLHSSSTITKEMLKGARTKDCLNSQPTVAAFQIRPLRYRHELANAEMVKKAVTNAARLSFLPPWVVNIIEAGNHTADFHWVNLWAREITKLLVLDEMMEMGELLMGAAMIEPLQTCRAICQVLGDTVLADSVEGDHIQERQERAPCLFVFLARFTAQMMMMSVWALKAGERRLAEIEQEGGEEVAPIKRLRFEDDLVEDVEDEAGMLTEHIKEMRGTLEALINRMVKACSKDMLKSSVSAVSLILKEIATGPVTDASKTLKTMVPYELLKKLVHIDPLSVPFELFCSFVLDKEQRLELLCKWKQSKGIEYEEADEQTEEDKKTHAVPSIPPGRFSKTRILQ